MCASRTRRLVGRVLRWASLPVLMLTLMLAEPAQAAAPLDGERITAWARWSHTAFKRGRRVRSVWVRQRVCRVRAYGVRRCAVRRVRRPVVVRARPRARAGIGYRQAPSPTYYSRPAPYARQAPPPTYYSQPAPRPQSYGPSTGGGQNFYGRPTPRPQSYGPSTGGSQRFYRR